jgi:hypothetical protein
MTEEQLFKFFASPEGIAATEKLIRECNPSAYMKTELIKDGQAHLHKVAAAILVIDCARQIIHEAKKVGPLTVVPAQLILDLREVLDFFDKTPV